MDKEYIELLRKYRDSFAEINNYLTESAWFYKTDDPELFYVLQHYESAFREFYLDNFKMRKLLLASSLAWIANDIYWQAWPALIAETVAMLINLRTIHRLNQA